VCAGWTVKPAEIVSKNLGIVCDEQEATVLKLRAGARREKIGRFCDFGQQNGNIRTAVDEKTAP
jgi:hypothetical protein